MDTQFVDLLLCNEDKEGTEGYRLKALLISHGEDHYYWLSQCSSYVYVKQLLVFFVNYIHSQGKCHMQCHLWAYGSYLKEKA